MQHEKFQLPEFGIIIYGGFATIGGIEFDPFEMEVKMNIDLIPLELDGFKSNGFVTFKSN